jgi:hypothetical protein
MRSNHKHNARVHARNAEDQAERIAEDDTEREAQRSSYLRMYGQKQYDKMYNAKPGAHNLTQEQVEQMYGGGPRAHNIKSQFHPAGMSQNFTPQYVTVVTHP